MGGWADAKALRKANALQKGDERILGDSNFVETVLSEAKEAYERRYQLKAKGIDIDSIAHRAAQIAGIEPSQVWASGKGPKAWLSKRLRLSQPAISLSVARGRTIAIQNNYGIENL